MITGTYQMSPPSATATRQAETRVPMKKYDGHDGLKTVYRTHRSGNFVLVHLIEVSAFLLLNSLYTIPTPAATNSTPTTRSNAFTQLERVTRQ